MADLGQPALSLGRDAFSVRRNQLEVTLSETSLSLRGSLRTPDGSSDVRNVAHQQAPNGCEGPALPLARGDQKVT